MLFGSLSDLARFTNFDLFRACRADWEFSAPPACHTFLSIALRWLESHQNELVAMPVGRHQIVPPPVVRGSDKIIPTGQADIYANVEDTRLRTTDEALFERHYKYADIQMVLEGEEAFQVALDGLESQTPYSMDLDIEFFRGSPCLYGVLKPGQFVIYRAGEFHRPALSTAQSPAVIRKVVIKVRDDGKIPRV